MLRGPAAQTDRHSDIPLLLVTGTGVDPRPRMRVDPGDTAFYESRQFTVSHEFSLAAGISTWLRFTVPVDIIVKHRKLVVLQGAVRSVVHSGGTWTGSWTGKSPFRVNAMASRSAYIRQVVVAEGSAVTRTGSAEVSPPLIAETSNGQAVMATATADESGLAPETYYLEIRNTGQSGAARGYYESVWEEVQPRSSIIY